MCNCRTAHAHPNNYHLVRAAPRHPCAVCEHKKNPPGEGGEKQLALVRILRMYLVNIRTPQCAASRPEKQFTRDALKRSLSR